MSFFSPESLRSTTRKVHSFGLPFFFPPASFLFAVFVDRSHGAFVSVTLCFVVPGHAFSFFSLNVFF